MVGLAHDLLGNPLTLRGHFEKLPTDDTLD